MKLFPWDTPKPLFKEEDQARIVQAIRASETRTSGEIRVFVENRCRFVDALDRAAEIFFGLEMDETKHRNGVLVYVALKDHQLAIFADQEIYQRLGREYWENEVREMIREFNRDHYAEGIVKVVNDIGSALAHHFPYEHTEDKNELPDDIVFGH